METGIKGHSTMTVTEDKVAASVGSGSMSVLSTPSMLALIESTAWHSVLPCLEEGQGTVGTKVELDHLAATPPGAEVVCDTELIEVDRRKLTFTATVRCGETIIGTCRHERFIVDEARFLSKVGL
jgi:predicted thioesterase